MLLSFKSGILTGFRQWRIALTVYLFQLLLAATLGVQVYHVLEASIGQSLELDKLLGNYDHTVIRDLFHVHGASISPLLGQLRWLAISYLIFSIFIHAGILYTVLKGEKNWITFWVGGATYFFRFLKISLVYFLLLTVISAVFWLPFLSFFITSPEYFSSEKISVWLLVLMLIIYLFILMFIYCWSLLVKIKIIQENSKIWPAIKSAWIWLIRHYVSTTILVFLFFMLHIIIFFLYWLLNDTGVVSVGWVLFLLLLQQVVAFLRVMMRVMAFGGVVDFYSSSKPTAHPAS